MRVVCISDTHNLHTKIPLPMPEGDVLVHAGDMTGRGGRLEIIRFNDWLGNLPYRHKVVIAGNHDLLFEDEPAEAMELLTAATYLRDSAVVIDGVKFYGSPWQPRFFDWAFNLDRGPALKDVWSKIPNDTDVLITHGPPYGVLDRVLGTSVPQADGDPHVGCLDLAARIAMVRPRLAVFGHIHEGYGTHNMGATTYVNASICDAGYRPIHAPIVVDMEFSPGAPPFGGSR